MAVGQSEQKKSWRNRRREDACRCWLMTVMALSALTTLSCGESEAPRAALGVDYVKRPGPMRSKARGALPHLKADEFDDIRGLNPERYAITASPARTVRPMVEWEEMRALMLAIPSYMTGYANAFNSLVDIARHGLAFGEVWIIVGSDALADTLRNTIRERGGDEALISARLRTINQPLESVWLVDFGPQPIIDPASGTFAFADYRYYHDRPRDDGVPTWLGRALPDMLGLASPTTTYRMPLNMEGGTFQATEDGLCFTGDRQIYHMSCAAGGCEPALLVTPLPELNEHPLVANLRSMWSRYLGCAEVLVTRSVSDDATGHLDMYLKVLPGARVLLGQYSEPFSADTPAAENGARMDENASFLSGLETPSGAALEVIRMEMPGHRSSAEGDGVSRVPFTYLNATFFNGLNLWPAFSFPDWEASRSRAEAVWEEVLPDYTHIWVDSEELSFWSGAVHCVSRTIPAGEPGLWVPDGACGDCGCVSGGEGYEGPCQPGSAQAPVCFGPAWECSCRRCDVACALDPVRGPAPDPCLGIDGQGCCDEETGELRRCVDGVLESTVCEVGCGGDPEGRGAQCGGVGAGPSCALAASRFASCEPDCSDKSCGGDGCGGHCGTCGACEQCIDDQCALSCSDRCEESESGCEGDVRHECAIGRSGCLERLERDCGALGQVCADSGCVDPPLLVSAEASKTRGCDAARPDPSLWLWCCAALWGWRRCGTRRGAELLRQARH